LEFTVFVLLDGLSFARGGLAGHEVFRQKLSAGMNMKYFSSNLNY
jgi:hypothetical protein